MRIFEPGDQQGSILKHRTIKVPYFFHTVLASPYLRKSSSRIMLDPLGGTLLPPSENNLYQIVPSESAVSLSREIQNEVILVPAVPAEEEVYGRLCALAEHLLPKNNAILAQVDGPPYPELPNGVTPIVSLLPLFSGDAALAEIVDPFSSGPAPLFLYPLLPGLSDQEVLIDTLQKVAERVSDCSVVPVQPVLNRAATEFILSRVDAGEGDAGRAYDILFQTARSAVEERLIEHFFAAAVQLGISGLVPLTTSDKAFQDNLMISQRALKLWHYLLSMGDEDLAWAWYRAGVRIREIRHPLSTLIEEGNLQLLDIDGRVLTGLTTYYSEGSALLSSEEAKWIPV